MIVKYTLCVALVIACVAVMTVSSATIDTMTFSSTFEYKSAADAYEIFKTTSVMFTLQPFV